MTGDVTQLLIDLRGGDGRDAARQLAAEELFPLVLEELRRVAARLLAGERRGHTLQTTALVNEVYLRLAKQEQAQANGTSQLEEPGNRSGGWQDRAHFLAVAAQAMRHILVDHARQRNRQKRGGSGRPPSADCDGSDRPAGAAGDRVPLDSALLVKYETSAGVDIEALNAALTELSSIRPRAAQIVDMRFFADMTIAEIACVLNVSVSTVEREWRYARAWLKDALSGTELERGGQG